MALDHVTVLVVSYNSQFWLAAHRDFYLRCPHLIIVDNASKMIVEILNAPDSGEWACTACGAAYLDGIDLFEEATTSKRVVA